MEGKIASQSPEIEQPQQEQSVTRIVPSAIYDRIETIHTAIRDEITKLDRHQSPIVEKTEEMAQQKPHRIITLDQRRESQRIRPYTQVVTIVDEKDPNRTLTFKEKVFPKASNGHDIAIPMEIYEHPAFRKNRTQPSMPLFEWGEGKDKDHVIIRRVVQLQFPEKATNTEPKGKLTEVPIELQIPRKAAEDVVDEFIAKGSPFSDGGLEYDVGFSADGRYVIKSPHYTEKIDIDRTITEMNRKMRLMLDHGYYNFAPVVPVIRELPNGQRELYFVQRRLDLSTSSIQSLLSRSGIDYTTVKRIISDASLTLQDIKDNFLPLEPLPKIDTPWICIDFTRISPLDQTKTL